MRSRTENSLRNISYGLINKFLSIIFPFITRTIFIKVLGKEMLGLNSLYVSILQVLSLAELGFGSAIVYSMYKPIAENDEKKVGALLYFYKKCYFIIGIIITLIGIIVIPFLNSFISGDIPDNLNIYFLYLIFLFNTVISYYLFGYKSSLLIANQRNDVISKIGLVLIIVQNIVQIIVLLLLKSYYIYILFLPITTIINNLLVSFFVDKYYSNYTFYKSDISYEEKQIIKLNIKGLIFQKIGGIVLSNVDSIVISSFLGLSILGEYNNYYYIITSLFSILFIIMDTLKSSVGNSIALESKDKNYSDFKTFNFIYYWIVTCMCCCFISVVQDFITMWIGTDYLLPNYIIYLFCIYLFIFKWCDMCYVYQEAAGLWFQNRYTQFIGALLNLVLNIFLVKIIGLPGILISTIISIFFIIDIGYSKILFRDYFKNNKYFDYLINQLIYLIVAFFTIFVSYKLSLHISFINSYITILIKLLVSIVFPNLIMCLFFMRNNEFMNSIKFVRKIIYRGRHEIN